MAERTRIHITRHDWLLIGGLSCVWLCMQSSGFFPLSIIPNIGDANSADVALLHLMYSSELLIACIVLIACRTYIEPLLQTSRALPIVLGILGLAGQAILANATSSELASPLILAALPCIAIYIAGLLVLWGEHCTAESAQKAITLTLVSYPLSQVICIILASFNLPAGPIFCTIAVASAFLGYYARSTEPIKRSFAFSSLKTLPWNIIAIVTFLIYFCVIYVRFSITTYSGDSTTTYKMFASALCLVSFGAIAVYFFSKPVAEQNFMIGFVALIGVYVVGLVIISLFPESDALPRRVLIAGEHCAEAFLWLVLAYNLARNHTSAVLSFGIYGIAVVVLPWVLSFDVRYLVPIPQSVLTSSALQAAVTIALAVTALATIIILLTYIQRTLNENAHATAATQQEVLDQAFERAFASVELTPRELEVARLVYRGYSAKRAAEVLYVSEPTVKNYTSRVYRKLGIHSKQELIAYVDNCST